MTLSRFLSNYIFRSVYKKGSAYRNYYVATMATFLVSGFWHGAGWTFVVWGIVNGFFVCTASWMKRKNLKLPFLIAFPMTAIGVVLCRVLFVSNSFADVALVYRYMFDIGSLGSTLPAILKSVVKFVMYHKSIGWLPAVGLFICWFLPNSKTMTEKFKPTLLNALFSITLMLACVVQMNKVVQFLYFQF